MKFFNYCFQLISTFFLLVDSARTLGRIDFNLYHTTNKIDDFMKELCTQHSDLISQVSAAELFSEEAISDFSRKKYEKLKYYVITDHNSKVLNKTRAFLLGGEHPRELISSEFLMNFMGKLVNGKINKEERMQHILSNFELRVIVNGNPLGRERVESGEYCTRTNPNNVDINRNWEGFWQDADKVFRSEENPGTRPFSEYETEFIHRAIKDFSPKLFLSVHSGVYGLYLPYAYTDRIATYNRENMLSALAEIKNKFCSTCQMGPPGRLIGYTSSGTCLDFIYETYKVPYSLAWEIYSNEVQLPELETARQKNSFESTRQQAVLSNLRGSSFLEFSSRINTGLSYTEYDKNLCLTLFNPTDKLSYEFVIKNWTNALLTLFNYIQKN